MPNPAPLRGLIAAVHTPFKKNGALNLEIIEVQAAHLLKDRVNQVFVAGTTGECTSLQIEERMALVERWCRQAPGASMTVIVHVGANNLADAAELARHAESAGAAAIAAFPPCYFKPNSIESLTQCCAQIAAAAPSTPFYFYHIPALTRVELAMPDFLEHARSRIPTLAGIKFSSQDLAEYQFCLNSSKETWDLPFGVDEQYLGALALGAKSAIGSSYNFAAPLFLRLQAAFDRGDLIAARAEQFAAAKLIRTLGRLGYLGASKAAMRLFGVDVGPARLPLTNPTAEAAGQIRKAITASGLLARTKCVKYPD